MSSTYTFQWPKGPNEVILTGTFDNWSKSLYLVKQSDGSFLLTVPLPQESGKLLYKYVVDGEWVVSPTQNITKDDAGIENNVLTKEDLAIASSTSVIPESGLPISSAAGATAGAAALASGDVKTTVMPKEEGHATIAGEPGIHVPQNPETIAAFSEVSDVDPKTLNQEISAEEKKKQKKKVKRKQYKAKKKAAAAGITASPSTTTEAEVTPEPENDHKVVEAAGVAGVGAGVGAATAAAIAVDHPTLDPKAQEVPGSFPEETEPQPVVPAETAPVEKSIPEPVTVSEPVSEPVAPVIAPISETKAPEVDAAPVAAPVAAESDITQSVGTTAPQTETEPVERAEHFSEVPPSASVAAAIAGGSAAGVTTEKAEVPEVSASKVAETPETAPASVPLTTAVPEAAPGSEAAKDAAVKKDNESEEIIIAQGGENSKNLEQQIRAEHGDVSVEEIQPTESEAQKLREEAHLDSKDKTASVPAKTTPAKTSSEETRDKKKKKKSGFLAKLKKIFK